MTRTYTVEWQRPNETEHQVCTGLDRRTLVARLIGAVANNGSIIVHRVEGERRSAHAHCPVCYIERADYEGEPGAYLPRCPNCATTAAPRLDSAVERALTQGDQDGPHISNSRDQVRDAD